MEGTSIRFTLRYTPYCVLIHRASIWPPEAFTLPSAQPGKWSKKSTSLSAWSQDEYAAMSETTGKVPGSNRTIREGNLCDYMIPT